MRYSMRWSEFNLSRLPALVGGHFLSDDVRDRGPLTNEAQHKRSYYEAVRPRGGSRPPVRRRAAALLRRRPHSFHLPLDLPLRRTCGGVRRHGGAQLDMTLSLRKC
jgi:hypothetical protein